ncbi:uncharacterized protein B0H18DRAFT_1121788 [Fomitopsis serialis]|uniref:uncharacterized protein n=1 Tax=Fomitopsis serialis TaxID=139415 RepID=UPI00200730C5|nr:uncharacterized protein B0H18DRAFT_1121788 [Neoantrodia serialis]KAH9920696.1 hypothetical protein B0H18DRAFT_1121788 [Neoantrodia serialis]
MTGSIPLEPLSYCLPHLHLQKKTELSELTEEEQEENSKAEVRNSSRPRDSKRKRGSLLPPDLMWDWAYKNNKKTEKGDWRTRLVEEEGGQSGPANAMEEGEDEEQVRSNDDDDPDRAVPHEVESEGEGEGEEPRAPLRTLRRWSHPQTILSKTGSNSRAAFYKGAPSPELTDEENADDDEAGESPTLKMSLAHVPHANRQRRWTRLDGIAFMDVDQIVPPPLLVALTPHMAAASSIMAGSTVVAPPSPSPSPSSSTSDSLSSSHSPSSDADAPSARDSEPEPEVKGSRPSRKTRARARGRKARVEAAADRDLDTADQAAGADGPAGGVGDVGEADLDFPELEMELESDPQPVHRTETLDVLAVIELKFGVGATNPCGTLAGCRLFAGDLRLSPTADSPPPEIDLQGQDDDHPRFTPSTVDAVALDG